MNLLSKTKVGRKEPVRLLFRSSSFEHSSPNIKTPSKKDL
jgi:hypothetical protein